MLLLQVELVREPPAENTADVTNNGAARIWENGSGKRRQP